MQPLKPDEILPALAERCGARTREGGTCHNRPMLGGTRCRMHGGASPQARAKAAERLAQARDLALETLIRRIDEEGDLLDPRLLLESTVRLTEKVELLEGRATDRKESRTVRDPDQIRQELTARIDDLRERRAKREAAG